MPNSGTVTTTNNNGISTITFEHPAHNSMPSNQLKDLAEAIKNAGEDEQCNVIILKSGGNRTFCAGASFDELLAVSTEAEGLAFFSGFANVINAMRQCPKFILGRVQGKAVGGGVGLLSACDLTFATKFASIKLSELAIGIGPFVIGPAVERKTGNAKFGEMAIRADDWFDASYAKACGLYTEVYENIDALDEAISKRAQTLNGYHLEAMKEMKAVLWQGTDNWNELLKTRAGISGTLVTKPWTRAALAKLKPKAAS